KGFAFVEMADDAAAQRAVKELNGQMVDGRDLKVAEARPREARPREDDRRGGGYGGGGSRRF
ncbi:MAG: RNA-binding protein, partial [Chloroflexota bacterium]|nr:RNA-binding protein [Chloroflexota bacterium]